MAKQTNTIDKLFSNVIDDINATSSSGPKDQIPDIITFCEHKDWLALSDSNTNPIFLYPMQKIILKVFYRGSIGNENVVLTPAELKMCDALGLTSSDKGNIIEKYNSGDLFKELILVWGRRSSKDFLASIIAAYEAMKLLECEGGDPYALYEISAANPLNILIVANSGKQSHVAFNEIREKIIKSPYFINKIGPDGITAQAIYLLTPKDKEDNVDRKKRGLPLSKGSVCVIVGHSNSDTLLGWGCIVLILDEVASYKSTGSSSSGDRIYAALTPTIRTYVRKEYQKDEDGNFVFDENGQRIVLSREYDGKTISISSPRAKEGKFYDLYAQTDQVSQRFTSMSRINIPSR